MAEGEARGKGLYIRYCNGQLGMPLNYLNMAFMGNAIAPTVIKPDKLLQPQALSFSLSLVLLGSFDRLNRTTHETDTARNIVTSGVSVKG